VNAARRSNPHDVCVLCAAVKIQKFDLSALPVPAITDATTRLLGAAAFVAALMLASHWLTELTAPRPVARLPEAAQTPPDTSASGTLGRMFGVNETQPQAVEGLRLTGLFANAKGGGFATFHTPKGDVSVFPGNEVAPGIKLKQIERDRVILSTPDAQRELRLSDERGPAGPIASAPVQAAAVAPAQNYPGAGATRRRHARQSSQGEEE
jgi:hypothetical protein